VDYYTAKPVELFVEVIESRSLDARSAFVALQEGHARIFTMEDWPLGCLVSFVFAHAPPEVAALAELTGVIRRWAERSMVDRLTGGIEDGD
jgi:hypothetical protein